MSNALIYTGSWKLMDDVTEVQMNISDKSVFVEPGDDPETIELQMGANPLVVSVIDNSKDKLTPVRAKSATIEIKTENGVDITTFTGGADSRFFVEIFIKNTGLFIFYGYLVTADIRQPFLPNMQTLVLTAVDGLGLISDVPLTDFDGINPTGKNKIINYLAWALSKTGLDLEIKCINNLRHGSGILTNQAAFSVAAQYIVIAGLHTDFFYAGQEIEITNSVSNDGIYRVTAVDNSGTVTVIYIDATITVIENTVGVVFTDTSSTTHFYDTVYLDAKTFESEIGECENCRTVIEKILGEDCVLTQYLGSWWIYRLDEYDENLFDVITFDPDGTPGAFTEDNDYGKAIGEMEALRFVLADCDLSRERELGFAKLKFNFQNALEVPCNIDFSRGTIISDTPTQKIYDLECWDKLYHNGTGDHPSAATIQLFVDYVDGYETSRYVKFYDNGVFNFIMSDEIPVSQGDKATIDVNRRMESNHGTGGSDYCVQLRLYGDNGTFWTHHGKNASASPDANTAYWQSCDSLFTTNQKLFVFEVSDDHNDTESIALYSGEVAAVPVSGYIKILVYTSALYGGTEDCFIEKVSFDYIPYINGSYQKYSGQHQKVLRGVDGYLNKRERDVYISDSPKKLFKCDMFLLVNGNYVLTTHFYPYNVFGSNYPGDGYCHPYGEHQIRSVFNQGVYANWVFDGSILGMTDEWPDIIHKYSITDAHATTSNRYFVVTGFDQNWKTGIMRCTLIEVYDRILGHVYSQQREFKYITG
jgi:hypothetical protein